MKVTIVAYDDSDVKVFAHEKDALQYLVNTEINEGGSCEEDREYLGGLSKADWNRELHGICSVYTATVYEETPN